MAIAQGENRVRIIAGRWRGRWVQFSAAEGLRPTPSRVRETLFNWLGQRLDGLSCLDLFSGSGALGFEALSRGARRVVMVEKHPASARMLEQNAIRLGAAGAEIRIADADRWLDDNRERFDVIFLDPPFAENRHAALLERLCAHLAPGGRLYCESSGGVSESGQWHVVRSAKAGKVWHQLLEPVQENVA